MNPDVLTEFDEGRKQRPEPTLEELIELRNRIAELCDLGVVAISRGTIQLDIDLWKKVVPQTAFIRTTWNGEFVESSIMHPDGFEIVTLV